MYFNDHMNAAIEMARNAFNQDEVPVGAIVVKDGEIILMFSYRKALIVRL